MWADAVWCGPERCDRGIEKREMVCVGGGLQHGGTPRKKFRGSRWRTRIVEFAGRDESLVEGSTNDQFGDGRGMGNGWASISDNKILG